MPDYPTSGPAAGWYTDPADPGQERWWGGVEWTHDVRPRTAAPVIVALQPALADVSGGGFGAYTPTFSGGSSDYASPAAFGAQRSRFGTQNSWGGAATVAPYQPPPTSGIATAGLLFSIFGFALVGIILSSFGLKKAREFELSGQLPVGRKRSRWGIGLGIAAIIITTALVAAYVLAWPQIYASYLEHRASSTSQLDDVPKAGDDALIYTADGTIAIYNRAEMEQGFIDGFTDSTGRPPESLACPDEVDMVVGASFTCTFSYDGVPHVVDSTFTDSTGSTTVSLDGVVVP